MRIKNMFMTGTIISIIFIAGCFQGEQSLNEIDPPVDAEPVSDTTTVEDVAEESEEEANSLDSVARELYLIDGNGMVASQILELPLLESKEVATQLLEYLVVDGPVSEILPNGFRAVLPAGTEILGVNLKDDGTMIVDLSEEFTSYNADDEMKVIESMTHTLTQFDNVERIKLWINGHPLDEMPVDGTPLNEGYSRANGINLLHNDTLDYMTSKAVTMYYPMNNESTRYYVPVTQYVEVDEDNPFDMIVKVLMDGSLYNQDLLHVFNSGTTLTQEPQYKDGILELVFNEAILQDAETNIIADEVVETLVRTLTSDELVEAVSIKVENIDTVVNEHGEVYDRPVSTDFFLPGEKL